MLNDLADTIGHLQGKYRAKLELRIDKLEAFKAALEAEYGPMTFDPEANGPWYAGIPIVEDALVSPGMAVVLQDGFVVDIIRYAPEEAT